MDGTLDGLPNTPSELLSLALDDLEKCEQDTLYGVLMDAWHEPVFDEDHEFQRCDVCLAGAVMAKTLDVDPEDHVPAVCEYDWSPLVATDSVIADKLTSIEYFRQGLVRKGVDEFFVCDETPEFKAWAGEKVGFTEPDVDVIDYKENPVLFKKQMRQIVEHLNHLGM